MASTLFELTISDVQGKLFPGASEDVEFSIGDGVNDQISTSETESILNLMEGRLLSMLHRSPYKRLLTKVEGEVLTYRSTEGETTFTTTLAPVTNLKVFVNYPRGFYEIRYGEDVTELNYTPNLTTGEIVFESPIPVGSRVVVDYNHNAAPQLDILKHIVLNWTAVEISRRYNFFQSDTVLQRFEDWDAQATAIAMGLSKGELGIHLLDKINLIRNETDDVSPYDFILRL